MNHYHLTDIIGLPTTSSAVLNVFVFFNQELLFDFNSEAYVSRKIKAMYSLFLYKQANKNDSLVKRPQNSVRDAQHRVTCWK